ncbi:uncharacterized protein LOC142101692 [Mixophyes fleayi]|uniref:uncharacterized protein LOC142101692 n=1 Tax=Mixophyes fleayi TaxID=3061075 RepID=UPI003F4DE150
MRHITNKPISPRNDKEASSLDGITISCTNNSQKWLKDSQIISGREEENKSNRSLSSLETIESGTTEVSSEVTIPTMGSGGSLPSIGSEHPSKSSIQNCSLELDHPSLAKGTNISFYSKLKRGLHVKRSTDTRQEKAVVHGKSSPWRTTSPSPSSQTVTNESVPCHIGKNRVKMNATPSVESENTIPVKAPLLSMRMMQSLLKKNRPKNYVVSVPSPTQQESRPQSGFKREQVSEQASARLLTARPGSSRGLYLTKRN